MLSLKAGFYKDRMVVGTEVIGRATQIPLDANCPDPIEGIH
jgi:hypothetical protein